MSLFGMHLPISFFIVASLYVSVPTAAQNNEPKAASSEATPEVTQASHQAPLPLQDLRLFTLIFDHIRRSYVTPVSDKTLLENAIKGMLQELDPHSDYLDTTHFNSLQETTRGEFSGVGLEIGSENGYIKVITPVDGSPAQKAGLQAGDLIIKLDNQSIRGLSLSESAKKMRGPKGTAVIFTVIRQGQEMPIDITVTRDTIKTRSTRSRIIEQYFGYIRVAQFQANTGKDFSTEVTKLLNKNPQLKGFVLDFRNNPGGVLRASVEVADALINDGLIVYTKGRLPNSNQSFTASKGDIANGLPIVALINGGSASAAEIVAGALQDQQRAIIMGTRSFGKGSVQTVLPVGKDKGIKLTTALYFTPKGRSIQAQGIEPDVIIKPAKITQLNEGTRVKEANLSGHITNKSGKKKVAKAAENTQTTEDNQLFEAINMLKGLSIFHQAKAAPDLKNKQ